MAQQTTDAPANIPWLMPLPPNMMPPAHLLWEQYWAVQVQQTKDACRAEGAARAADVSHRNNCGIYLFAGNLDLLTLKRFFNRIYPGVLVIKRMMPFAHGTWIVLFETHEMAEAIIREGHGRLPFPEKNFPWFDLATWQYSNGNDAIFRLDISWVRRKKKERKEQRFI